MLPHHCAPDAHEPKDMLQEHRFCQNQMQKCYFPAVVIKYKLLCYLIPELILKDERECSSNFRLRLQDWYVSLCVHVNGWYILMCLYNVCVGLLQLPFCYLRKGLCVSMIVVSALIRN